MRLSHWITITFFSWFQFQFNFTNTDTKHTFGLLHSWFLRRSWPGGRLDNPQMMRSTSCPESAGHNKTGRSLFLLILYKYLYFINLLQFISTFSTCKYWPQTVKDCWIFQKHLRDALFLRHFPFAILRPISKQQNSSALPVFGPLASMAKKIRLPPEISLLCVSAGPKLWDGDTTEKVLIL